MELSTWLQDFKKVIDFVVETSPFSYFIIGSVASFLLSKVIKTFSWFERKKGAWLREIFTPTLLFYKKKKGDFFMNILLLFLLILLLSLLDLDLEDSYNV